MDAQSPLLPDYAIEWGNAPVAESTTWLGEGDFCHCYLVNATFVFRFAKHQEASAAMRIERCVLPSLHNYLAVAVPQPLFADRQNGTGHGLRGYRLIQGEPLDSDVLASLPSTSQAVLISQMADFARRLHAFPTRLVGDCTIPTLDPLQHFVSIMAQAQTAMRPRIIDDVWRYHQGLLDMCVEQHALSSYQPSFLHGDLSPDHVLVDLEQLRVTGVVDFGHMCIGDPAWDGTYIYEDYGLNVLQTFLQRYHAHTAQLMEQKVRIYQQLNNVAYCLSVLRSGDKPR